MKLKIMNDVEEDRKELADQVFLELQRIMQTYRMTGIIKRTFIPIPSWMRVDFRPEDNFLQVSWETR
jgi:hypothetical protein